MNRKLQYILILVIFFLLPMVSFRALGVDQEADSLLSVLKSEDLSEDRKAILFYQLGLNNYRTQNYVEAIEYTNKALAIFEKQNDKHRIGKVIEQLGIVYGEFSDYQKSIEYLLDALKIAEETKDTSSINSRNFNIGTTFIEAGNNHKGILFLKKALPYYQKTSQHNIMFLLAVYSNLGVGFKGLGEVDSAMYYYHKSIYYANVNKKNEHVGAPLLNIGEIYQNQKKIDKAQKYYTEARDAFKQVNDQRGFWHAKFAMASIYAEQNKEGAVDLLLEVQNHFKETNDLEYLKKTYNVLSQIYEQRANYSEALEYKKNLINVKDSIASAEIITKINDLDLHYRIEKLQAENRNKYQLLEQEQKISTLYWYMATGFLVLIIILTISRYNRKKSQKRLVEIELRNSELEKKQLSNELEFRNKELETFALHIVQKNDFLQDVKHSLKQIKKVSTDKSLPEINDLNLKITQALKINKELENFRERVDEVNGQFFRLLSLKFPNLTDKEKRLCALLKLNLSSKEIASLNDITEGAVTMARYRLRKKLGLTNEENLIAFFKPFVRFR